VLEVFDSTGTPYSTVVRRQRDRIAAAAASASHPDDSDRLSVGSEAEQRRGDEDALVVWLQVADRAEHARRLDGRVDSMLQRGLLQEIAALRDHLRAPIAPPAGAVAAGKAEAADALSGDVPSELTQRVLASYVASQPADVFSRIEASEASCDGLGLLQAIGYKEFRDYLDLQDAPTPTDSTCNVPPPAKRAKLGSGSVLSAEGRREKALRESVDKLKVTTRVYAKKQDKFIRNRFHAKGIPMLALDTSSIFTDAGTVDKPQNTPSSWTRLVFEPALAAASRFLAGEKPLSEIGSAEANAQDLSWHENPGAEVSVGAVALKGGIRATMDADRIFSWKKYTCEPCGKVLNGEKDWVHHLQSKGHRGALAYQQMREKLARERGIILPERGSKAQGKQSKSQSLEQTGASGHLKAN
jgi:hypothetical protein